MKTFIKKACMNDEDGYIMTHKQDEDFNDIENEEDDEELIKELDKIKPEEELHNIIKSINKRN